MNSEKFEIAFCNDRMIDGQTCNICHAFDVVSMRAIFSALCAKFLRVEVYSVLAGEVKIVESYDNT